MTLFFQDGCFMSNAQAFDIIFPILIVISYLLTVRPILNVITISCSKAVSTNLPLKPHSPQQSLNIPSQPLPRQSCQTSVYVIILIILLTLNDRPRNFRKRASEQVTEQSLTADRLDGTHPARFGRIHPVRLGSAHSVSLGRNHPARFGTTRPARLGSALPPGSTLHP